MKKNLFLAVTLGLIVSVASAAGLKSGPEKGEFVGAFHVVKRAGAPNDGVGEGAELCYRCKLGSRPVVMVFARSTDKELVALVKEIDSTVKKHKSAKLASFVNLMGKDQAELSANAKKLAQKGRLKEVAVVVPLDQRDTEEQFKLDPNAEVTVVLYNKSKVEKTFALRHGKLNEKVIARISADAAKMVN